MRQGHDCGAAPAAMALHDRLRATPLREAWAEWWSRRIRLRPMPPLSLRRRFQDGLDSIAAQRGRVLGFRRKAADRLVNDGGLEGCELGATPAGHPFGECRTGRNGRRAAAHFVPDLA